MEHPKRYSTIILALDGTRRTEAILDHGRELATLYGATLVLVRATDRQSLPAATDPTSGPSVALSAGPPMDSVAGIDIPTVGVRPGDDFVPAQPIDDPDAAGYLNILDHELEASGLTVEHVDTDDDPADAIVAQARARDASLIVMGTHQRKGLDRFFKGSIAEKVLRESPCPVLVVPLG